MSDTTLKMLLLGDVRPTTEDVDKLSRLARQVAALDRVEYVNSALSDLYGGRE